MSAVKCETQDCSGFMLPKLPTVTGLYNQIIHIFQYLSSQEARGLVSVVAKL